jgi:hypothetical protein
VRGADVPEAQRGALRAERAQRLGVELHRQRQLGHRHELVAETRDVHVGVRDGRELERGLRALEDRPARISGELVEADDALALGRPVRRTSAGSGWRSCTRPRRNVNALSIARPSNQCANVLSSPTS